MHLADLITLMNGKEDRQSPSEVPCGICVMPRIALVPRLELTTLVAWICANVTRVSAGFCGVMSIFSSLRYCLGDPSSMGNVWAALWFLPFGLFFDFLDGRVARWRHKSSLMGQELDSLADLVWRYLLYGCGMRLSNARTCFHIHFFCYWRSLTLTGSE